MSVLDEVLSANDRYAATFGEKAQLSLPPARRFAILTCMDARLDPAKYAGLTEGDAHVIRNAGGWAGDGPVSETTYHFRADGVLIYSYGGRTHANGTWKQQGDGVYWEANNRFC